MYGRNLFFIVMFSKAVILIVSNMNSVMTTIAIKPPFFPGKKQFFLTVDTMHQDRLLSLIVYAP